MSDDKTISEQLADLRQLIKTSFELSQTASAAIHAAQSAAHGSFDAATNASQALDGIVTKLGFSVPAPERVVAPLASAEPAAVTSDDLEPEIAAAAQKRSCKTTARPKVDHERDKKVHAMRAQGLSHGAIGRRLGMTRGAIYRSIQRGKKHAPAAPVAESVAETKNVVVSSDLFNLDGVALSGATEQVVVGLLVKKYPAFTTPQEIVEVAGLANETIASPTITRLRQRGVAIESAQQARRQGAEIPSGETGWRLIPKD